ncbi:alcohol oxidase [Punctularia strigosozonata HHB-11173 SS5]|uniref:Alcohol oxidase n=1 Tax=Punctularia strigosozonata (strain HHB-11173) TaxID=741275 RepID=R7S2M1_PUNST|nr:alcohol oxidase [Punctularia strigosozonata HHB-11173 SS5]EIN03496.1 alcohol oxidase [Punctularia strigosozonata HHB-11173 SS5]
MLSRLRTTQWLADFETTRHEDSPILMHTTMQSLAALALALLAHGRIIDLNSEPLVQDLYDYVIVGGGTAGMVISSRLSENPSVRVAVLEAGGSGIGNENISCPGLIAAVLGTQVDWNFKTVPQQFAANQSITWPRGKVLGGSTAINGRVLTRGSKAEYDAFEKLGNPGWNWDSLLAAVNKAEHLHLPSQHLEDKYRYQFEPNSYGTDGPLDLTFSPWWSTAVEHGFFPSAQLLGHPLLPDGNDGNATGLRFIPAHVHQTGRRTTAFTAYYDPSRPNLDLYTFGRVSRLIFAGTAVPLTATGVEFICPNGTIGTLRVSKEVIVSAGTVQAPQVLELSGIGDPAVLVPLGIDVLYANTGVGANLQDHVIANSVWALKPQYYFQTYTALEENATYFTESLNLWAKHGVGIMASSTPQLQYSSLSQLVDEDGMEEARKLLASKPSWLSDAQFTVLKSHILGDNPILEYCPIPVQGSNVPEPGVGYLLFQNAMQHELSRGTVHINTSDPLAAPVINPRYLESEFDTWLIAQGMMHLRKITEQKPFQDVLDGEVLPGNHPIGTASMLPESDGGVVDPEARVYGTANVRIADASVIPMHISAHTTNIVYAFAERIADIIKGTS